MSQKSEVTSTPLSDVDPTEYTITIKRVMVDAISYFRATVSELPDVEAFEASFAEAYKVAIDAIQTLSVLAKELQKPFPQPERSRLTHSGRFTLRMPKTLHARLDSMAQEEGVSLNSLMVTLLSSSPVGHAPFVIQQPSGARPPFGNAGVRFSHIYMLAKNYEIAVAPRLEESTQEVLSYLSSFQKSLEIPLGIEHAQSR